MLEHPVTKLRKELLLSRRELAARAGVAPRTVDHIESGHRVRQSTRDKILLFFQSHGLIPEDCSPLAAVAYFPAYNTHSRAGAKPLPLHGLLWLHLQYLQNDYDAAAEHLKDQNYKLPENLPFAAELAKEFSK